jgi:hypothetical protein
MGDSYLVGAVVSVCVSGIGLDRATTGQTLSRPKVIKLITPSVLWKRPH